MTKPLTQGRIDGLCGLYSTINAFDYLLGGINAERLFKQLIQYRHDQFPQALWDGTELPVVQDWIDHAALLLKTKVTVGLPFSKIKFSTADEYLGALAPLVRPANAVAVVGLGKPWDHWTVIKGQRGRTVLFHDSYGLDRRRWDWFTIGRDSTRTQIVTKETILITLIG